MKTQTTGHRIQRRADADGIRGIRTEATDNESFDQLFNNLPEAFALHEILCDGNGKPFDYRFLKVNPAFGTMTGIDIDTLIGKTVLEILPQTEPYWIETYGRVALTGEPVSFQQYSQSLKRHYDVRAYSPRPGQFVTIFRDITEQERTHQALKRSEAKYRTLLEQSPGIIYEYGIKQGGLYYSPQVTEILGYSLESLSANPFLWKQSIHPDDSSRIVEATKHLGPGNRFSLEYRIKDAKGHWIWLNDRSIGMREEAGDVIVTGLAIDITDRKQAEQTLEKSESRLREAQQVAHLGSWELDLVEDVLWWSDENYKVFGVTPDKNTYETFLTTVHPDDREFVDQAYTGSVKNHTAYDIEHRLLMPDGSVKWVNERCQTYYGDDGTPLRSTGTTLDITERKNSEIKLYTSLEQTIRSMAATVELRDPYTAGHQKRVADLAVAIAKKMHLDDERVRGIQFAAVIHDLGKINIPTEILSFPGKLDAIQRRLVQQHVKDGYEVLKDIEFPWPIAQTVLQHHERMDGSGYPQGLSGEEIIPEARIVAVADVVEAISSHRPYRASFGIETALDEIRKNRGALYDETVVDACLSLFENDGYNIPDEKQTATLSRLSPS